MLKKLYWSSCKVSVILVRLKWSLNFIDFRKFILYQISWKSVQWQPSCSMRTDGQSWRSQQSLFVIVRTRLKIEANPNEDSRYPNQIWKSCIFDEPLYPLISSALSFSWGIKPIVTSTCKRFEKNTTALFQHKPHAGHWYSDSVRGGWPGFELHCWQHTSSHTHPSHTFLGPSTLLYNA